MPDALKRAPAATGASAGAPGGGDPAGAPGGGGPAGAPPERELDVRTPGRQLSDPPGAGPRSRGAALALRRRLVRLRWVPVVVGAGFVVWLGLDGFGNYGTAISGGFCLRGASVSGALAQVASRGSVRCIPLGWSDRLYFTFELFKGSLNGDPPYPTALEAARWLALVTTAYAGYRAVAGMLAESWTRVRVARLAHGHVVVCGLGSCGTRIARGFRDAGTEVVSIELLPTPEQRREHRRRGMFVIQGDATANDVLAAARVAKAGAVVVCCGDDALNARVALLGQELCGSNAGATRWFVQLQDAEMRALLETGALGSQRGFELFNVFELGPRALLDAYPAALAGRPGRPPRLAVVGAGTMASSVVVEAARRRSLELDGGAPLEVLLLATGAKAATARLAARYRHLGAACRLVPVEVATEALAAAALIEEGAAPDAWFVCVDDEYEGLRAALRLRRRLAPSVPLVLCSLWRDDAEPLLALAAGAATAGLERIGLLDLVCTPSTLLEGDNEVIARAIHAGYVAGEMRRGARVEDNPALVPWQRLPEELRQSNREQAAGLRDVLARAGFTLVESGDWTPPLELTEDEVELLARFEHERWTRDLTARGWQLGPRKDPSTRRHPALVEFDRLAQADRERTLDAARRMPRYLAYHGISVVRPARRAAS
ncbi:MAG TPA: NAD-binding protein [Acidimicrobiales bacterium]|nr:NAD-binding protein [Acidimicrobiales bacterium]